MPYGMYKISHLKAFISLYICSYLRFLPVFQCLIWDLLSALLHCRDSVGRHFFASLYGLHTHYKGLQSPSFSAYFISQVMLEEGRSFYKSLHQLYKSLRQIDELMGETFLASLSTISASFLKNAKQ